MGFLICSFLYFLPTIIAIRRGHRATGIFVLNLLFGWTVIGWIAMLAWAFTLPDYRVWGWYGRSYIPWDGRPLAPIYCWTCRRPY